MNDKELPRDLDSEEAVISSLLIDGELIKSVRVEPSDFFYEQNQLIFKAMLELKETGEKVNQLTVAQRLHAQGKLETIGGAAHLSHLISVCPTSLDCDSYADIVRRLSTSRNLVAASDQIAALGYAASPDTATSLAEADSILLKLRQHAGGTTIINPDERTHLMYDRYLELYARQKGIAISTGLNDIDYMLGGGFFPGELTVLAAAPSVGKTALAQSISNYIATQYNVLFCIGEMGYKDMSDRDVAGVLHLKTDDIRRGGYQFETYSMIVNEALPYISSLKVYYVEAGVNFKFDTAHIYHEAYDMVLRHGVGLLVIDSLGLLSDTEGNNRNEILGNASRNIKLMGEELKIPVLLLHHISRDVKNRPDKRPMLTDLYESGHIEQTADNVLFMYRDDYYYKTPEVWAKSFPGKEYPQNIVEIDLAKHRQGETSRTKILWLSETQQYVNLARDGQEERLL